MDPNDKISPHTMYVDSFTADRNRKEWAVSSYNKTSSCYGCSKAERVLIPPRNEYEEVCEQARDVKFSCDILTQRRKQAISSCNVGDRKYKNRRCDKCEYGSHAIDLTVKNDNPRETTTHIMYQCSLPENQDIVTRGYYSCDKFQAKEVTEE